MDSDANLRCQKYYKNDQFMENRKVIKNQLVQQGKNHALRIPNFLPPLLGGEYEHTIAHHCKTLKVTIGFASRKKK